MKIIIILKSYRNVNFSSIKVLLIKVHSKRIIAKKLLILDLANMLISDFNLNNSINFEDNINIDILDKLTSEEDMTTIIAVKCNEGIIIASNSQSTAGTTKNLMTSKIFQVSKFAGLGCAGFIGHINNLVDKMKEKLNDELMTDLDTKKNINDGLLELHKQYNIEYPKKSDRIPLFRILRVQEFSD